MGEVGKLWAATDKINSNYTKAKGKKRVFGSAEEEAMDEFIAKTKAREMEDELRELIMYTRGADAWTELIRLRGEARKRRKQEAIDAAKARQDRIDFYLQLAVGTVATLFGSFCIYLMFSAIISSR